MREQDFRTWLAQVYVTTRGTRMSDGAQSSRVSNCSRVEQFEGDLDQHFARDELASLIQRLTYSRSAAEAGAMPDHCIPINGDQHTGTATLLAAVRLYQSFSCVWPAGQQPPQSVPAPVSGNQRRRDPQRANRAWPSWPQPDDHEIYKLATIVTPFVRFLNPEIIRLLLADNETRRDNWCDALHCLNIEPSAYLWPRAVCAFPGIRRYAGRREREQFHANNLQREVRQLQALALDDNDYPKHIWSFVFRGRPFQKFGPDGYTLAHLADHKAHKNRFAEEFDVTQTPPDPPLLYGLYTSPTNTVYVPSALIKPTDFAGAIRNLLLRRSAELYGEFCELLPPWLAIPEAHDSTWATSAFDWAEPVGDCQHVEEFLELRNRRLAELVDQATRTVNEPSNDGTVPG